MSWIGIDLHTDRFNYCRMESDESTTTGVHDLSPEGISAFRGLLCRGDRIAVESTGNTSWFRDQLAGDVAEFVSVDSRQFAVVHRSTGKNDRRDARLLAFYLYKGLLPRSRIKSPVSEDLSALLQTREHYVRERTVLFNRIRSQYNSCGVKLAAGRLGSRKHLFSLDLSIFSESKRFQIELYRSEILHIQGIIAEVENRIKSLASPIRGYEGLVSITGISFRCAAVLLSEIDDIGDFPSPGHLTSYFGLAPRTKESNGVIRHGRITRRGSPLVRKFLVQAALTCIRHSEYMNRFYSGIRDRRGHSKAIIATARKLLETVHRVLRHDLVFEDYNTYTLRRPDGANRPSGLTAPAAKGIGKKD